MWLCLQRHHCHIAPRKLRFGNSNILATWSTDLLRYSEKHSVCHSGAASDHFSFGVIGKGGSLQNPAWNNAFSRCRRVRPRAGDFNVKCGFTGPADGAQEVERFG